MKIINRNNFITWTGEFKKSPNIAQALNDSAQVGVSQGSIVIYPLTNDKSTFGINAKTFEFTFQDNPAKPATWDSVAQKITYYPPSDVQAGEIRLLKYRWTDYGGNVSNEATISIAINAAATIWRPYPPSLVCLKDANNQNTGYSYYQLLELAYFDTAIAVDPHTTKANVEGDPDYHVPAQNLVYCPLPDPNAGHLSQAFVIEPLQGGYPVARFSLSDGITLDTTIGVSGIALAHYTGQPDVEIQFTGEIFPGDTSATSYYGQYDELYVGSPYSGTTIKPGSVTIYPTYSKALESDRIVDLQLIIL